MSKGLSRQVITSAALVVLDAQGISGVTVRAVAAQLGIQAPTLYYHVRSKQDLLDEMGTEIQRRVVGRLANHPDDHEWDHDLAAYGSALRQEYLAHRDGARAFSGTLITDANVLAAPEPWLARWQRDGVPLASAFDALEIVTAFVVGFVIEEQERAQSADQPGRYEDHARDARLGDTAPLIKAAGRARHDPDSRFPRQLEIVIAGLVHEARRACV